MELNSIKGNIKSKTTRFFPVLKLISIIIIIRGAIATGHGSTHLLWTLNTVFVRWTSEITILSHSGIYVYLLRLSLHICGGFKALKHFWNHFCNLKSISKNKKKYPKLDMPNQKHLNIHRSQKFIKFQNQFENKTIGQNDVENWELSTISILHNIDACWQNVPFQSIHSWIFVGENTL